MGAGRVELWAALGALVLGAAPALGQERDPPASDATPWEPVMATHLGGAHGLTGFGSMVDGRVPSPLLAAPDTSDPLGTSTARFCLRYELTGRLRRVRTTDGRLQLEERRHALIAQHALSVQGLDLTLGLPYRLERERLVALGAPDPGLEQGEGVGDVLLGAKLGLRVPGFLFGEWAIAALGPYVLGRLQTGEGVGGPSQVEVGLAVAGPYGYGFRWNGNLALRQRSGGETAIVFRAGGSGVPLADGEHALRVYAHVAGAEPEGWPRPDLDVELGAQLLLFRALTLDLGASVRVLDSGVADRALRRSLRRGSTAAVMSVRDEGSFWLTFGVGVVL